MVPTAVLIFGRVQVIQRRPSIVAGPCAQETPTSSQAERRKFKPRRREEVKSEEVIEEVIEEVETQQVDEQVWQ